ncbi:Uma2 family endonuclease [Thioalkalicoccus limnaeus]|uniref:Uma2 family endonuclease n=1 Tax=Thioalkalicoccus limnaeus TaxID=120681 RepID=A0ABV4BBE2_9GAMM
MSQTATVFPVRIDTYLQGELGSESRHEYVAGQTFMMAGAGERHSRIAGNLFFHLRGAIRGTPCGVFVSDMKVRITAHDSFYYPDVLVTCDPSDRESLNKTTPCLIAEVLSPATEIIDRREKLIAYRTLPSLRDYLLISQDSRRVERYYRDAAGHWTHEIIEDGGLQIVCGDLDVALTLADLYEDVVFED